MAIPSYDLPPFLEGRVTAQKYRRWLHRKASAHARRDRKRVPAPIELALYKQRIHQAVCQSDGVDWYTGEALEWEKISTYDNAESKLNRSKYKAGLALLPTLDHQLGETGVMISLSAAGAPMTRKMT
ncbi:MAG TPA: hypothetical protein VG821_05570 [Rhizomicrobium sp.]|nr:hypothetical protein [Rhizomicrobium sp.]